MVHSTVVEKQTRHFAVLVGAYYGDVVKTFDSLSSQQFIEKSVKEHKKTFQVRYSDK